MITTHSIIKKSFIAYLIGCAIAIPLPVLASVLKMDATQSKVNITFKQMGVPVDAQFKKFSANIDYNAAKPETSKASVTIDLASFDLGDPEYNKEVLKKEWFNTAQFPQASFVSTGMKSTANGGLLVTGNLSIKGKTAVTSFNLSSKKEAKHLVFEGSIPIKRLAFGIGDGEWKDTSMVADEVVIKFKVVTNP
jgi:polyisoprenoid-binding protein YceI